MDDEWTQKRLNYWIGRCLTQLDRHAEARPILERVLLWAEQNGSARTAGNSANLLVTNCIALGDLEGAAGYQARSATIVERVNDQRQLAALCQVTGRLHMMQNNQEAAQASFAEAIDLFERLGMRRELAEARAELARLKDPGVPAGSVTETAHRTTGARSSGPVPA